MRLLFTNVVLICYFFTVSVALATDTVYENTANNSFVFEYSSSPPNEHSINNFFIREIAKFNFTSLYNTRFVYNYSIHKSITQTSPNFFVVSIEFTGEKCTGDIYYRDFNISDILIPEEVDFNVTVIDKNNYIETREFKEVTVNAENKFSVEYSFEAPYKNVAYVLKISDINFYSEKKDRQKFFDRINSVDNYYASIAAIDYAMDQFVKIQLKPSAIVETYLQIQELERIYSHVTNSDFIKTLDIEHHDVAGYFEKLTHFKRNLQRYDSYYDILLNSVDYLKLKISPSEIAQGYINQISDYFILAQHVTHSQSTYFYNLGRVDYNHTSINGIQSGLNKILLKTPYCNDLNQIYKVFEQEIFGAYMEKANFFIRQENYYIAKGILDNAECFFKTISRKSEPVELRILISKADYGIYDSYLHLIDRAIDVGNYDLAENYIDKAQSFQQDNSASIISDEHIRRISEKLATLYLQKGSQLNKDEDYSNALYCFEQAQKICYNINEYNYEYEIRHGLIQSKNGWYDSLIALAGLNLESGKIEVAIALMDEAKSLMNKYESKILPSEQSNLIISRINYYYYNSLISEGEKFLDSGNYNLAYQKFLDAFHLEENSDFAYSDKLPKLFAEAATPVLEDICSLGEVKVQNHQLDEARAIYDKCLRLQDEYGLIYEPRLQQGLTLLNNNIFNAHCEYENQEFDAIIVLFNNAVKQGDFISAIDFLNQTDEIVSKNYYCEFDRALVAELKQTYSPAAEYQELAKTAQDALNSNDHQKFIEVHQKMEILSENYEVIRKYIEPLPLHYLFSVKKNLALLESSVNYFENRDEYETALKLLKVLEANNFSDKDTKGIQQKLANKLALADKEDATALDPKLNVEKYTEGNPYYKHFKKTYIKSW